MTKLRIALATAVLALISVASVPAQATIMITCSGQAACSGFNYSGANNSLVGVPNTLLGTFDVATMQVYGQGYLAYGGLLNVTNIDINSSGTGTLNLFITETNLTANAVVNFVANMSATFTSIKETRTFYLDPTNSGLQTIQLAQESGNGTGAQHVVVGNPQSLNGLYSITEKITLNANGFGSLGSTDDLSISEPASLSIIGSGLLALGAMFGRRRRKQSKPA